MKNKLKKVVSVLLLASMVCVIMFAIGCSCSTDSGGTTPTPTPEPKVTYTVTFDSAGGTDVQSVTVASGEKIAEPTAPTKLPDVNAEYEFDGWYNGDVKWVFNTNTVTGNVTLTAHWKKSSEFSKETTLK